ncbi:sterol homeostasis protein [Coccidioides posadasii str. Silveira]|uniref:Protein ARV n=1 Tax=Coccidioides posadasii (strain RMSCC 757 / Silveira) TaxID=443226 RepID=E9DEY6_COCPS|nr:conserved hypothetical protein [Coccidioides posadasii str. Silveira]QVM09811.1 sterol homeostasis protein [Coccidioides posadasii str. Silveira]
MPICIECCYPVSHLYTSYSKADDRALGKGVRLTQCPRCRRFADKYVEHDFVVLFIDLVLIKPQVYRHLLFNRLGRDDDKFDRSIIRLGILILLFDVYIAWARIERSAAIGNSKLANAPIIIQYVFFLTVNALATLAHHLIVRALAFVFVSRPTSAAGTQNQSLSDAGNPARIGGDASSPPSVTLVPLTATLATQSQPIVSSPPHHKLSRAASWNSTTTPLGPARSDSPAPPPFSGFPTATTLIQPMSRPSSASSNAISTALVVSSCTKLFPILLVIWNPDSSDSSNTANSSLSSSVPSTAIFSHRISSVTATVTRSTNSVTSTPTLPSPEPSMSLTSPASWGSSPVLQPILSLLLSVTNTHLVLLNNVEALYILLDCGYLRAAVITLGGQLARWVVERSLLRLVGL